MKTQDTSISVVASSHNAQPLETHARAELLMLAGRAALDAKNAAKRLKAELAQYGNDGWGRLEVNYGMGWDRVSLLAS